MTDTGRKNQDFKEKISTGEPMRLNKFLSDAGVCSRRQADRYVEQGRITIDGEPAQMGQKVLASQDIRVDGKRVTVSRKQIVLAVNKPKGIVCTTEKRERDNIVDFLKYPERVYPVGRLDKDSEGLILMTNEKEYEVTINRPVTNAFLKQMSEGVEILDTVTRPCKVKKIGVYTFRIILTQGMNRQIRRMCEACGYRVRELKRLRIMNIHLGDLPTGKYREITGEELSKLEKLAGRKPGGVYHG